MDGSYHGWLGDVTLPVAVDDSTGGVVNALFCDHEDTSSYFRLMQGLLRCFGIPLALYTDRHPVFKHKLEYQPAGTPTQFGRAMEELGIQLIFALSPQAKGRVGRVERMAETFQDRLVTELRLASASTIGEANEILRSSFPGSTPSSPSRRSTQRRLTARCPPNCPCTKRSVSDTASRWDGTTRSSTTGGSCNWCREQTAPAMPVSGWRS